MDVGLLRENYDKAPLEVKYLNLRPAGSVEAFARQCPECTVGMLLGKRSELTFELMPIDTCTNCARRVSYLDIAEVAKKFPVKSLAVLLIDKFDYGINCKKFLHKYFTELMIQAHGSVHLAAAIAGLNRTAIYLNLKKAGVKPSDFIKLRLPAREIKKRIAEARVARVTYEKELNDKNVDIRFPNLNRNAGHERTSHPG